MVETVFRLLEVKALIKVKRKNVWLRFIGHWNQVKINPINYGNTLEGAIKFDACEK